MTLKQKHFFITSGILAAFLGLNFIMPSFAFAYGGYGQPFGLQIITMYVPPNVTCYADSGPATANVVSGVGANWSFSAVSEAAPNTSITPGAWVIGMYTASSTCMQINGPVETPYPTTYSSFYGTSF